MAGDDMGEKGWKVGQLAAEAGLTVRTLHYFDEIGLLTPAARSHSGHRLYRDADVRRLYRIVALRDLGLPLAEVATALDDPDHSMRSAVEHQLARAEQRIAAQQRLREQLLAVLSALRQAQDPTIDQLIQTMEAMMQGQYFTPEQLARMKDRHREVGAGAFGQWLQRAGELNAEALLQAERGVDPADPQAQETARRWRELMDDMTGGDRGILSSMYAKLDGKGAEAATMGAVSTAAWTYLKRALLLGPGPYRPGPQEAQPS